MARAAAVLDEGFDVATLAALADVDENVAARATGELSQAEVLRPSQPLGFVHPLIRAAVYQEIPPGERELAHTAAARRLADAGAPVERVASHLLEVPPRADEWAYNALREAARQAMKKGAADSAVAYFRRAIDEPPPDERQRTETLLELGLVESLTYAPAAVEHLRDAYEGLHDPVARGLAANVLARSLLWIAPQEAAALARAAAAGMPPELEEQRQTLQAFEAATVAFGVDAPEAIERLIPYRHRVPQGLGEKAMAAVAAWEWTHANGPREDCVALGLGALSGGELIAADGGLLPVYAILPLILGDREEVMDAWEQMLAAAHRRGSMLGITTILLWRGYTLYRRGDLPEAEQSLRDAAESFPQYGYGEAGTTYVGAHLAAILTERGDLVGARAALNENADPGAVDAARYWLQAEMALRLAEGKPEAVLDIADELPLRLPWMVNPTDAYWRSYKALALDRLDRTEEAIELVNEELELARELGCARDGWPGPARPWDDRPSQRDRAPDRIDRAALAVDDATRIREGALRAGHGDPPGAQAERGSRPALPSPGAGDRVRSERTRGACPDRAWGHRRAPAPRGPERRRRSHAIRKAGRRPRRGWSFQPRDRPGALRDPEDRRGAPLEHVSQARDPARGDTSRGPWRLERQMSESGLLERDDEVAALANFVDGVEGAGASSWSSRGRPGSARARCWQRPGGWRLRTACG